MVSGAASIPLAKSDPIDSEVGGAAGSAGKCGVTSPVLVQRRSIWEFALSVAYFIGPGT
jgi:hypothetical protein